MPSPETVNKALAETRKGSANYEYFFNHLRSPAWIEPLEENGFFRRPPAPEMDGDYIRFPIWPESRYLTRMASLSPEVVQKVALKIPETKNARVHEDLLEAACAMPAHLAAELARREGAWVATQRHLYLSLSEHLGSLVGHLARGGQTESALGLARCLLTVFPDPDAGSVKEQGDPYWLPHPQARFSTWEYKDILAKHMPDLVRHVGQAGLLFFCDLLKDAVRFSLRARDGDGPRDYSHVWRPAIEDHEQNHVDDLRSLLVTAVRDAATLLVGMHGKAILEIVETGAFTVFRRIGMYLRTKWPEVDPDGTAALFDDTALFEDVDLQHELYCLLEERFGELPSKCQQTYLDWVTGGIDIEKWRDRRQEQDGRRPTLEEGEQRRRRWQYAKLWPVRHFLAGRWRSRLNALRAELGEPEHPDFPFYVSDFWTGPTSPKTVEDLGAMSVDELIAFLSTWQPSGEPRSASEDGLARSVAALVSSQPERFAAQAAAFRGLDPTYVRGLIMGLGEAAKQKAFPWRSVLDLCEWVVEQPREIPGRQGEYADLDPGWVWTRKAIAGLFSSGFEANVAQVPFDLRPAVWKVIVPLTDDPEPTPEYEARWGAPGTGAAGLSINTVRGEAMHAVVRYALWVRRGFEEQSDANERLQRGFGEMPEVRQVLEHHLDPKHDPSLAVRSVYGQRLPWLVLLDRAWTAEWVSRILPSGTEFGSFRDAAWSAYIAFCSPYDRVFDVLRQEYQRAVERIGAVPGQPRVLPSSDDGLAEHLMTYYWRGKIELDSEGLLASFYAKATDKLRGHAIEFAGLKLGRMTGLGTSRAIERLQALWTQRVTAARQSPDATAHRAELEAFGSWFISGKLDDRWALARLNEVLTLVGKVEPTHMVIARLAAIAASVPGEAVECLRLIAEGDKERWRIEGSREGMRKLFATVLASSTEAVRGPAIDLIHKLGARGHLWLRDLLPPTES